MNQDSTPSSDRIIKTESCDHSGSAPASHEGIMRRDWLKSVMIGGVGLGLFGIPLPSFGEESAITGCPRIIRVSKNVNARIVRYQCERCMCDKDQVFLIKCDFSGTLLANKACDEAANMIPDKSIAKGSLKYTLRSGICPDTRTPMLWGCHEGRLMLYAPSGRMLLDVPLAGTHGVNPDLSSSKRCCWPYADGAFRDKGTEELKACMICASYLLKVPFNFSNPCTKTPPNPLIMQLDGTMMCPC